MEPCLKLPDMKTSLKQQGDGENLNLDRQLTGCVSPQNLASNPAPASALLAIKDFVTTLSRSILAFLISFNSYQTLIHLYWSYCTGSVHQIASSLYYFPSSQSIWLYLFSRMSVTSALPEYETNCYHPSSFKNHCLNFHILLLLRRLRYILPTFIY